MSVPVEDFESASPAAKPTLPLRAVPPTKARLRDGSREASKDASKERPESPPLLERHDLFASTVLLAGSRFPCNPHVSEDWPGSSTMNSTMRSVSSNAPMSARGAPRQHAQTWGGGRETWGGAPTAWRPAPLSARNNREGSLEGPCLRDSRTDLISSNSQKTNKTDGRQSCVPIRPWLLPRDDGIPCAVTGRRAGQKGTAGEIHIRIFIRLPGGNRFALWVPPDMLVGPLSATSEAQTKEPHPISAIFAAGSTPGSALMDSSSSSTKGDGRLTPLRALLAGQAEDRSLDMFGEDEDLIGEISEASPVQGSLKDLIEAATGIPAESQKLVVGLRGPLWDANKQLCTYDVGHGAQLHLSIKHDGSRKDVQFLATPRLKQLHAESHDSSSLYDHMDTFMKSKSTCGSRVAKDLVEPLPDWHVSMEHEAKGSTSRSSELYYQDYTYLRDNHIFDLAGRIRKRFRALPRVAQSAAVPSNAVNEAGKVLQEAAAKQCPVTGRRRSITEMKGFTQSFEPKTPKGGVQGGPADDDGRVLGRRSSFSGIGGPLSPKKPQSPGKTPKGEESRGRRETLQWVNMLQLERQFEQEHQYSVKRDPTTKFQI